MSDADVRAAERVIARHQSLDPWANKMSDEHKQELLRQLRGLCERWREKADREDNRLAARPHSDLPGGYPWDGCADDLEDLLESAQVTHETDEAAGLGVQA